MALFSVYPLTTARNSPGHRGHMQEEINYPTTAQEVTPYFPATHTVLPHISLS